MPARSLRSTLQVEVLKLSRVVRVNVTWRVNNYLPVGMAYMSYSWISSNNAARASVSVCIYAVAQHMNI